MATNNDHVYSFVNVKVSGTSSNPTSDQISKLPDVPQEPTSAISSTNTKEDDLNSKNKKKKGLSLEAIIGIVVAIVVVIAAAVVGIVIYIKRKRLYQESTKDNDPVQLDNPSDPL